ncbi:hypothetical protein N7453_008124 [Penicillium expansum]|nr:hypothetical protein N7453_008124 [Penicillium expansum]
MKPSTFLAFLAPVAVLADSQQPAAGASLSSDFAHNSPAVSLPELVPREQFAPFRGSRSAIRRDALACCSLCPPGAQ